MTETRADHLSTGDAIMVKGRRWTVSSAVVSGKRVALTVTDGRLSFSSVVKGKSVYDRVALESGNGERAGQDAAGRARVVSPGPLTTDSGSQSRWATDDESATLVPPAEASRSSDWGKVLKSDRGVVEQLGARLVGVEVEGGKLVVPPVDDSTILGHLLTMHGRRFDGVTFEEARAWAKANPATTDTAVQVMDALTLKRAFELHDEAHANFAQLTRPHWHRDRAPR